MPVDNNPTRWYLYQHKEKGGLSTSLETPDVRNKDDKYNVWGPFHNSEIVNKWVEKRRELSNDCQK